MVKWRLRTVTPGHGSRFENLYGNSWNTRLNPKQTYAQCFISIQWEVLSLIYHDIVIGLGATILNFNIEV
jgi:hypothetical protein